MAREVLIIGGGVIGLSIARELHIRGVRGITILEKGRCGEESSWAAAGMLSPQVDADYDSPFFRLCCDSRDRYPEFVSQVEAETGISTDFNQTGNLCVAFDEGQERILETRFQWQNRLGVNVEMLTANEARKLEPSLARDIRSALRLADDWQIDNRNLLKALKKFAVTNGIEVLENSSAGRIETADSHVTGVTTHGGFISGKTIILATGAWSSLIDIGGAKMPFDIKPVRGQVIAFRPSGSSLRHVVYAPGGYILPRTDGRVLAGSTSEDAGFDRSTTDEGRSQLREVAHTIMPELSGAEIVDQWAGLRPRAADDLPVIGQTDMDGMTVATGHYRNGILLAPITAKIVADKIADGTDSEYFDDFSPLRFASGRAITANV